MVGTQPHGPGGIAAIVRVYLAHGLFQRWPLTFIDSHVAGSATQKIRAFLSGLGAFLRLALRREVALLHLHVSAGASFWRKSSFALLAFAFHVPVIAHVHSGRFLEFHRRRSAPLRRFIRFVLERSDRVIALSPIWSEKLRLIAPGARLVCVPNPVLAAAGRPRELANRNVLFLGKIAPEKGVFDLLEALALVRARLPGTRLVLAGEGDTSEARMRADALGLHDSVELPGWISGARKEQLLRDTSVFALPSYFECMPMSLLEAMAIGIPCVASDVGGIPDIVSDGVEAALTPPGDVTALAQALERLLVDREAYVRLSEAALRRFSTCFAADVVMPQLENLYAEFGVQPALDAVPAKVTTMSARTAGAARESAGIVRASCGYPHKSGTDAT
jgi:glycosyltransferase involved in cell wall biosynthesis